MLRIYGADVMSEKENYILCVLQIKAMLRERLYGKIEIEHPFFTKRFNLCNNCILLLAASSYTSIPCHWLGC